MLQFLYQMETFPDWLEWQNKQRGWKPADLARAADLPDATISRILNGQRRAGPDACKKIARALNISQEEVFRQRGFLDPLPPGVLDNHMTPVERELISLHRRLNSDRRKIVLDIICGLVQGMSGHYTFIPASETDLTIDVYREVLDLADKDLYFDAVLKLLANTTTEQQLAISRKLDELDAEEDAAHEAGVTLGGSRTT